MPNVPYSYVVTWQLVTGNGSLNINLFLIKPFLITKFDCTYIFRGTGNEFARQAHGIFSLSKVVKIQTSVNIPNWLTNDAKPWGLLGFPFPVPLIFTLTCFFKIFVSSNSVLWSDECKIEIFGHNDRQHVRRPKGTVYTLRQ